MNRELIEQAAASYADSIPQFDDRKRYCREDFIAGAEWVIKYFSDKTYNAAFTEIKEMIYDSRQKENGKDGAQ